MVLRLQSILACSFLLLVAGAQAPASETPGALHLRMIQKHPAPALTRLSGREFKWLVDPARLPQAPEAAFAELWSRVEGAAEKAGFVTASRKGAKALKLETAVKEYLDTPGQDLWKQGYVLRVTAKARKGGGLRSVTVKAIHAEFERTMATPLLVQGAPAITEAEGNVGFGREGRLAEYVEKGSTWQVAAEELASLSLGDFGKYMPELLKLGLPASTRLVSTKVYALQVKAGSLTAPGVDPLPVSMEGWSRTEGGPIFLFDLSYRLAGSYYQGAASHEAAERFMTQVLGGELKDLNLPTSGRWGGSKVRALLNRPLSE